MRLNLTLNSPRNGSASGDLSESSDGSSSAQSPFRIYDNPSHRHYHAAQELRWILERLDLLKSDDSLFLLMGMKRWDTWLSEWIEHPLIPTTAEAMRITLQQIMNALKLPLTPSAMNRVDQQTRAIKGE